jgi:hypothetical protein
MFTFLGLFTKSEHINIPVNIIGLTMTSLFASKAIDVIRVLLVDYPRKWALRDLAREAHVSLGQVFKVSKALIDERLAIRASARSELKLMEPYSLVRRWAAVNNFTAHTRFIDYYTSEEDITELMEKLKSGKGPGYALTGLAGALLVAPYVRPANVHIYVTREEDAKRWARLLGLTPVEGSGNVRFAIAKGEGVFYGAYKIDGVNVVSDVQLYVDLLNYPARGEEAAGEVYKVIEKRWKKAEAE